MSDKLTRVSITKRRRFKGCHIDPHARAKQRRRIRNKMAKRSRKINRQRSRKKSRPC